RRRGGQRAGRCARQGRQRRRRAAGARPGERGAGDGQRRRIGAMRTERLVVWYSVALRWLGIILLVAVMSIDPRWIRQIPYVLVLVIAGLVLRALQIPLSKYSYLTQTGLVALAGSLVVGLPAAAFSVSASTFLVDWGWLRKSGRAASVNAGREVIATVAAY